MVSPSQRSQDLVGQLVLKEHSWFEGVYRMWVTTGLSFYAVTDQGYLLAFHYHDVFAWEYYWADRTFLIRDHRLNPRSRIFARFSSSRRVCIRVLLGDPFLKFHLQV